MSKLMLCGYCCSILSLWAIVQLSLMGFFFKIEAVTLIDDAEEHDPADYDDFISKTKKRYANIARNCWLTAIIYAITLLMSVGCVMYTKKKNKKLLADANDDDAICKALQKKQKKKDPKPTKEDRKETKKD